MSIPATPHPDYQAIGKRTSMTSFRHLPEPTIQSREAVDLEESSPESYLFFNETTRKYVQAYRQLEEQFEYLDAKLEETNNQLRQSLEEKDRVSKYLNNILESMSGGVLVLDLEGRITLFNQAAEEITGRSQEEVLGRRYEEVMGRERGRGQVGPLHARLRNRPADPGEGAEAPRWTHDPPSASAHPWSGITMARFWAPSRPSTTSPR